MKRAEPFLFFAAFAAMVTLLVHEGARASQLERAVGIAPKELYRRIARSQSAIQIVDIRPDVSQQYEDTHIPGSIPFPGCDPAATPEAARARIERTVPTVIVSEDGDPAAFARCAAHFTAARNLSGGLDAWVKANLPEDSGEYRPPKSGAGGGCL